MRRALAFVVFLLTLLGCGGGPAVRETAPAFPPPTPRLSAYTQIVSSRFDGARAMETVRFVDRFFRVRGNEGYQQTLAKVREQLAAQGFEASAMRTLELGEVRPTWQPRSARLALIAEDGSETELVAYADETGVDRAALLVNSDAMGAVELEVVRAEAVRAGTSARGRLVLAAGNPRQLHRELVATRGAVGLLVRDLAEYNRPAEHPEAARFGVLPAHEGSVSIGFSLSERNWQLLHAATARGVARVRTEIAVRVGRSAATTLEARIEGSEPEAGALVFVAHVDEPGAVDNASGVAALAELAGAMKRAITEGAAPAPRRTLVFLWTQEVEGTSEWLARQSVPVAAAMALDMVGADPETVGAPFLIERLPDPGAVWLRAPDQHTEWGEGEVDPASLRGHFLSDWLRAATGSVASLERGGWQTRTHPYEGGSDHVPFLRRGVPAVLAWHFTDDAYHTTRDRAERVSGDEMRRVAAVLGGAALAMTSGQRADREEMLAVVRAAALERLEWAERAAHDELAHGGALTIEQRVVRQWGAFYDEALRAIEAWDGDDDAMRAAIAEARGTVAARARDLEASLR